MTVQHGNRMRQYREGVTGEEGSDKPIVDRCRETAERAVQENPMIATLAVFGVGLGIGTLVGGLLANSRSSSRRQFTESVGRRVLSALSDFVPESIGQQFRE